MKAETIKELERIYRNYAKYGITMQNLTDIVKSRPDGISEKGATIGIRLALSNEYKEHEYFTVQDVAEITGETVEEVNKRIEENKDELMQSGGIVEVSSLLNGLF